MGVIEGLLQEQTRRIAMRAIVKVLEDVGIDDAGAGAVKGLLEMLVIAADAMATAVLDEQTGKERTFELHSDISADAVATQLYGEELAKCLPLLQAFPE